MTRYGKIELPRERYEWPVTGLPEPVVLVTTVDRNGEPHVATKSRVMVISYGPPTIVAFASQAVYPTAANIAEVPEFVINVPGDNLVATSWVIGQTPAEHGPRLLAENGLTPIPALAVRPPRIAECRLHLECRLVRDVAVGGEMVSFGEVVAVSADEAVFAGRSRDVDKTASYARLAPFFFLDADWTASLGPARRSDEPIPGPSLDLTVVATLDVTRAREFYSAAFGWPVRATAKGYVEFGLPGNRRVAFVHRDEVVHHSGRLAATDPEGDLGGVQLYLSCADLPRAVARLAAAGAKRLSPLMQRPWGDEATCFADPEGNVLILGWATKAAPADSTSKR